MRFATSVTLMAVAALGVAWQNKSKLDDWPSGASSGPRALGEDKTEQSKGVDAPPPRDPVTAVKLSPVIHEFGIDNVVPTAIVIQLAAPVVDRADVGRPTDKTVLKITPAVAGYVRYTGVSELTFTPSSPFAFDTQYQVELASVETRDGVMTAPPKDQWGEKWSYSFKTPKFAFLSWEAADLDLTKHTATMEISFSGQVLANVARTSMTFTIDGKPPTKVNVLSAREANMLTVQIFDARIAVGTKIGLAIKKGVPAANGTTLADAATAQFQESSDKAISMKYASVVEGANGFYVEGVGDDKAAETGNRSYYEGEGYYNLSQRCQLADASRISFTPAVKKVYITSGRAGFRIFGDFK